MKILFLVFEKYVLRINFSIILSGQRGLHPATVMVPRPAQLTP